MSYLDELTEKHGEHFVFSTTGNGMRTACAEVDTLRARLAVADAALAEARAKFKVGDKIVCVVDHINLEKGATYIVQTPCWPDQKSDQVTVTANFGVIGAEDCPFPVEYFADALTAENAALRDVLRDIADNGSEGACVKAQRALHPATKEGKA